MTCKHWCCLTFCTPGKIVINCCHIWPGLNHVSRGDLRQSIDGWVIPTQAVMDGIHPGIVAAAKKDACQRLAVWRVFDDLFSWDKLMILIGLQEWWLSDCDLDVDRKVSNTERDFGTPDLPCWWKALSGRPVHGHHPCVGLQVPRFTGFIFRNSEFVAPTTEELQRYVLDEEWRSRHRHLVRWWNTVLHQVNTIMFVAFSTKERCVSCSTWHVMIVCCVSLTIYFIVEIWSTEWLVGWTWLGFARSSSNKQGWEQWWRANSLFS